MSSLPDALYLNVSPSLKRFHQPLLRYLSHQVSIAQWDYQQDPDEPSSLEIALVLLHDYLKSGDRPIHVIGHGMAGVLGLLYARRHPERVKSLTLLGVGVYPGMDWHAQYYAQRHLLPCSQEILLAQMARRLFGDRDRAAIKALVSLLARDLATALSPHSLFQQVKFFPKGVSVPLLVCGGEWDTVVDRHQIESWSPLLKAGDRLWLCPQGLHFFHYLHAHTTSRQLVAFWRSLVPEPCEVFLTNHP